MTYGNSFCYHEAMDGCSTIDEYKKKIINCGDSSTGAMLLDLEKHFPDSKKVIIERDIHHSIEFCEATYNHVCRDSLYHLKNRLNETDGFRVKFDDIDINLRNIWEYLSDEPYNELRASRLRLLNIQVCDPHSIDLISAQRLSSEFL